MPLEVIEILGIRVHCINTDDMLKIVADWVAAQQQRMVLYVNAHCLNVAQDDAVYRTVLNTSDLMLADGVSIVWASRWLNGCRIERVTAADWIEPFCDFAVAGSWRIYVFAGRPGVAAKAQAMLESRFPGLNIVGTSDGFYRERSEADVVEHIAAAQPDIIFVGLGTPRQEKWLADHRQELPPGVYWTVGALFDYLAGIEPRAPEWMQTLGLEWSWRLLVNPTGKTRRYLIGNPMFVLRVLRQRLLSRRLMQSQ